MLEKVCRKGNPLRLLVGMSAGIATIKYRMAVPQKTKNQTIKSQIIQQPQSCIYLEKMKTVIWKDICQCSPQRCL